MIRIGPLEGAQHSFLNSNDTILSKVLKICWDIKNIFSLYQIRKDKNKQFKWILPKSKEDGLKIYTSLMRIMVGIDESFIICFDDREVCALMFSLFCFYQKLIFPCTAYFCIYCPEMNTNVEKQKQFGWKIIWLWFISALIVRCSYNSNPGICPLTAGTWVRLI